MRSILVAGAACAAAFSFAAVAAGTPKKAAAKKEAVTLSAADLKWGEAPPVLPKGAQIVVLHGNPFAKGEFAFRLKMPDGYRIAPHWHSLDEQLTVLTGTLVLHMGDTMDAPAHNLEPGSYHFLPGRMHHSAEAKGEMIVELHGMGPFDIHYLNPADDPTKATAATK